MIDPLRIGVTASEAAAAFARVAVTLTAVDEADPVTAALIRIRASRPWWCPAGVWFWWHGVDAPPRCHRPPYSASEARP